MVEGFTADADHGGPGVSRWVEGAPQKTFLFGVKLRGKTIIAIQTWRCQRCGFLENYATA